MSLHIDQPLAFPQPLNPAEYGRGLTMRDYFAAAALSANLHTVNPAYEPDPDAQAARAYRMADAMLRERLK